MKTKLRLIVVLSLCLPLAFVAATQTSHAAPQNDEDLSFSASLHGLGVEFNDHHVEAVRPGGGCIHQARFRVLGERNATFNYRVLAPDMETAHATSLLVALGAFEGLTPTQVVGVLNQAGFGVQIRVDQAGAIPPGPPNAVAHLVDLMKSSIDVASDRPGGGCLGLVPRLDAGLAALGIAGSCPAQQCQGPNCPAKP